MGPRGFAIGALAAAVLAASLGAAGWAVSDHLEQDDDFCNACHVSKEMPLHLEIRRDFDARPAASLAGAHAAARATHRDDGALRCIDCHGGTSLAGRVRVKALAAKDAFFYLTGRFEEPRAMRWPLWDEDCQKCHASFEERSDRKLALAGFSRARRAQRRVRRRLRRVPPGARRRRRSRRGVSGDRGGARAVRPLSFAIRTGRLSSMRRFHWLLAVAALVAPAGAIAYPGGTPDFQTDAAPYCAGCHSSRSAEALAGAGDRAAKEVAESKHLAVVLSGQKGYASLTEIDRHALAEQIRALDEASTVTLAAPASLCPARPSTCAST